MSRYVFAYSFVGSLAYGDPNLTFSFQRKHKWTEQKLKQLNVNHPKKSKPTASSSPVEKEKVSSFF